MSLIYAVLYIVFAVLIFSWNRGLLPVAASLAIILAIFAAIAAPAWFDRAKDGLDSPLLPEDLLGLLTLILVPVQILLIVIALIAFNQEWHVEEERPIGGAPLAGEDDEGFVPAPRLRRRPSRLEQAALLLAGLDQVRAVLADAVDEVADLTPDQQIVGRRSEQQRRSPSSAPGSSHCASASSASTTGIRSWTGRITLVGLAGDDRAAVQDPVAGAVGQLCPDPGKREQLAVGAAEPHRPLAPLVGQPLVEAVGGDQAAPLAKRLAERRLWLRPSPPGR